MTLIGIRAQFVNFRQFSAMFRYFRTCTLPNILVFSENNQRFEEVKGILCKFLDPNSYVIYAVDEETLKSNKSWQSTTRILILASDWECSAESVRAFLSKGGACLSLKSDESTKSSETEKNSTIVRKHGDGVFVSSTTNQDLARVLNDHFNITTVDNAVYEKKQNTFYSGYIVAEPFQEEAFFHHINAEYCASTMTYKLKAPSYSRQPGESIFIRRQRYGNTFNHKDYFTVLKTKNLGRTCLYFDTVSSTQAVLENSPSIPAGTVVVAKYQTVGRGRSGNVWLSPEGCAMFSFRTKFSLQCVMGQHLPLLQHIAALAVVSVARNLKGVEIGVKWPNDIYYRSDSESEGIFEKLGGVLVTSTIAGHEVLATVGIGVNLNNKRPTVCLNDILTEAGAKAISIEFFVASILNEVERLVYHVNTHRIDQVLDLYHSHWFHANAEVSVQKEQELVPAKIVGIDEYGFLRVQLKTSGDVVTVHPDGNSFDMLNGLLVPKIHR